MRFFKLKQGAITWDTLAPILLVLLFLLIALIIFGIISGKSFNLLDKLKGAFGG